VLTTLLSIGSSFPYVSDFFFNYFPLYNKFRAIESILAITELFVPILALLAISEVISGTTTRPELFKKLTISFYITGGLTLILLVYPEIFLSFKQSNQALFLANFTKVLKGNSQMASDIMRALQNDRESIERMDALRSLIFIVIAFGLLWAFIKQKVSAIVLSVGFFALILIDLWQVDKRYLKDADFQDKQDVSQLVQPSPVDQAIDRDTDPDFRVYNMTRDLKTDSYTPFFHKSIGGYSAARLKRFDELVDNQIWINPPNHDVLDMLNTKYVITQDTAGNLKMMQNETACGHAWFVKSIKFVPNADKEMQAISSFSPKDEAIVDESYRKLINTKLPIGNDPNASIKLVKYSPDDMVYESGSTSAQVAVFSEIYYNKGWKMYVDGAETPYFRADYVLRAAQLTTGTHKIEFKFHPASYYTGEKISLAGSIIMILALGGAVYAETRKKKKEAPVAEAAPHPHAVKKGKK